MARVARIVLPGLPYHLTHRGNRGSAVFFTTRDRETYKSWLNEYAQEYGMQVWAYCLMTNHIHLIAVGEKLDSIANTVGRTHMRFARRINRIHGWTGHLWANRFYSTVLDDSHLWNAAKYVELNPVRAGIVTRPEDFAWSSGRAHVLGQRDPLLAESRPFPGDMRDWGAWLSEDLEPETIDRLRKTTSTGRPCGSEMFISRLERALGKRLRPRKAGRKPSPVPK